MKCVVVLLVALAAAVSGFQYAKEWEAWKEEHGRVYESDGIELRRQITFESNMKFIEEHNAHADEHGYTVKMNKFGDLEDDEFARMYLGRAAPASHDDSTLMPILRQVPPNSIDWRTRGVVTGVQNQGSCNSCWAFAASGAMEGQYAISRGREHLVSLSEQQLVDCSGGFGTHGCNSGLEYDAFRYLVSVRGEESEANYPYVARKQNCRFNANLAVVGCRAPGYRRVTKGSEADLKVAVGNVGPTAVGIDASRASFRLYHAGIYNDPACSSIHLDHSVLTVGYGAEGGTDYWIVKNSWGTGWGENGYVKMSRNRHNQCGIATDASYPLIRLLA